MGPGVNSLWALVAGARHVLDFDARVRTREKALAVREVGEMQAERTRLTHALKDAWFQKVKHVIHKSVSNMPFSNCRLVCSRVRCSPLDLRGVKPM